MADEVIAVVKSIKKETMKRKDGTGEFTTVQLTMSNGQEFSGYADKVDDSLQEGDVAKILSQTRNKKDGSTYNSILSAAPSTDAPSTATKVSVTAKSMNTQAKRISTQTTNTSSTKSYDNKGARVGGVLHDAVAIEIHNATLSKRAVDLSNVTGIARDLLGVASNLEG